MAQIWQKKMMACLNCLQPISPRFQVPGPPLVLAVYLLVVDLLACWTINSRPLVDISLVHSGSFCTKMLQLANIHFIRLIKQ